MTRRPAAKQTQSACNLCTKLRERKFPTSKLGLIMADYYSVIADAISRLRSKNDDTRRRIYDRARRALEERLGTLDPPISQTVLANERVALDTAICRVEADISAQS